MFGKKEKIIIIVLTVILVGAIILSAVTGKKSKKPKNVVVSTTEATTANPDEGEIWYNVGDKDEEDTEEGTTEDLSYLFATESDSEQVTETTQEEITTEEYDNPQGDKVSVSPNVSETRVSKSDEESEVYWKDILDKQIAEVSTTVDKYSADSALDTANDTETRMKEGIKGILLGYIYGCPYATSKFKLENINGYIADVTDVEVTSIDLDSNTAVANVTTPDGTKTYNVSFTLSSEYIDDMIVTE